MADKKIRVLIAKPGLDGHDRGAKVIARALRDAGMEVIYTGLRQTPEMIASAAVQEDVDVIGLSILSGAHNTLCPQLMKMLHERGIDDVTVLFEFDAGIKNLEPLPHDVALRGAARFGKAHGDFATSLRGAPQARCEQGCLHASTAEGR